MEFSLVGTTEPFLHCHLELSESVFCESGAMVMMEDGLELCGEMRSGLFQSLVRRFASGESLFQQKISAVTAAGDCLLSPQLEGDIEILDVRAGQQYFLNDGAFVACSEQITMEGSVQRNIGGALLGQTGGLVIMKTVGQGQVVITGKGLIFAIDVTKDKPVTVDNGHVVCWDSTLEYDLSITTGGADRGMVSNLFNSVTSGEGFVLKFRGSGKVYLSSRNPSANKSFLQNAT